MFEYSAAPVVLIQESLLDGFPDGAPRPVCLDRDWPLIDRHAPEAWSKATVARPTRSLP